MDDQSPLVKVISICGWLYLATVLIAVPYYNWQYARNCGFVKWLVLGEVAPTAKALVWPYFALRTTDDQAPKTAVRPLSQRQMNEMNIMSANRAIEAAGQANYLINSKGPRSPLASHEVEKVIDYSLQSLRSADTTDEATLNGLFPEFGTRFKRDFCGGLRLLVSGLKEDSKSDLIRSSDLDRAWKDWYMANRKQIEDAFNAALQ